MTGETVRGYGPAGLASLVLVLVVLSGLVDVPGWVVMLPLRPLNDPFRRRGRTGTALMALSGTAISTPYTE